MRGALQSGFASAMVRTRFASSEATGLPGPEGAEALPVPENHSVRPNDVQRLSPPSPSLGEPHPEEAIEAAELWSLGSVAEQGELLPECQVFEGEVDAGSERRAQGAEQSEYDGIALHG